VIRFPAAVESRRCTVSLHRLNAALVEDVSSMQAEGRAKAPERVIVGFEPGEGGRGPRYRLAGSDRHFIRMNSNSYLSLSHHPKLIEAADHATHEFGVGPGAVRFIDGTFAHHVELEAAVARFVAKPAAKIFNSAYTANCGLALAVATPRTYWIGDALNHNSIIRAMRISGVPSGMKAIYAHAASTRSRPRPSAWWSSSTASSRCAVTTPRSTRSCAASHPTASASRRDWFR
jgi:glycine C-acetyltransferase